MTRRRVWVVAGPAGSGKTTLGRELARRTHAVLLDLDTLTNPLLDGLADLFEGHWNSPAHSDQLRPARYAALLAVAAEQTVGGSDLVLVAPFTAELSGGREWQALRATLAPVVPTVVWLDLPAEQRASRLRERGERRDTRPAIAADTLVPRVPHVRIDAGTDTAEQVDLLLRTTGRPDEAAG